jgi:hypothetical protein
MPSPRTEGGRIPDRALQARPCLAVAGLIQSSYVLHRDRLTVSSSLDMRALPTLQSRQTAHGPN